METIIPAHPGWDAHLLVGDDGYGLPENPAFTPSPIVAWHIQRDGDGWECTPLLPGAQRPQNRYIYETPDGVVVIPNLANMPTMDDARRYLKTLEPEDKE